MASDVIRRLKLQLSLSGTRQTDRGLKNTVQGMERLSSSTAEASKQTDGLANSLLKGSEAADKKLKSIEKAFAGSDRFLSIFSKLTAVIGFGTIAFKAGSAALELFTQKQKKAKKQTALLNKQLKIQADLMKKMSGAQSAFAQAVGVDSTEVPIDLLVQGTTAVAERERLVKAAADNAASAAVVARAGERNLAAMDKRVQALQSLVNTGLGTTETFKEIAKLQGEQVKQQKAIADAIRAADAARASAEAADNKAFNLIGAAKLAIDPTGGTPGNIGAPDDPSAASGAERAGRQSALAKFLEGAQKQAFERFKTNTIQGFRDIVAVLRTPLPELPLTGDNASNAINALGDAFSQFRPMADGLTRALTPLAEKVGATAVAFRDMVGEARAMAALKGQLVQFGAAAGDGLLHAGVSAAFYGESITKALAQSVQALGIEATVQALKSAALGFTAVAFKDPLAKMHFKAAAAWGAMGAAAGVAGAALGGGSGGGGGSAVAPAPTRRDLPQDRGSGGGTSITIINDLKSRPFATQREIDDATMAGVTRALRRAGGGGAAFRRELGR